MNNDNNMMPGIGDTAAQKERHNGTGENKKNRTRRNISAEAAHILKFLSSCTLYQADAVRVIVCHATGNGKSGEIEKADMTAVNRFLNHGMNKTNTASYEVVMRFRLERSEKLMNSVKPFCSQDEFFKATITLMRITTSSDAVKTAFDNLPDGK
ncbi:MAG: hypothetical protein NC344_01230 [Bacteroidales bacterium]|nr:hypothetical protein [Bacteroidales bacterium]MCM1146459.1 hypothetical protein [Bacteroidales bacterium]MCM1205103.1 hypothetical protein [Bacillota bacterium]MCM1509349.1 hypothetical protein [Clostridium sp.]